MLKNTIQYYCDFQHLRKLSHVFCWTSKSADGVYYSLNYYRVIVRLRVLYMCRKFMPKVMVGQYESQLRQLTTTLSDYRGRSKYPSSWPPSLSSHEIVIEA